MGVISDILPDIIPTVADAITKGGPKRQYKFNKKAMYDANDLNRQNQQWLYEQNYRLQQEQRMYDSPASQMARYKAAGLNPHLIYGSGGGGAGGAFPFDAGSLPGANLQPPSASYPAIGSSFLRAGQINAQTELSEARAVETAANTALKEIQIDIAKTNPMLQPWVASWVSTAMQETARLKTMEARSWMSRDRGETQSRMSNKVQMEIEALSQRLGLNTADLQIKNKILESKDFENAVKKVQAEWLENGDITSQHIYQGFMLLLSKMLGR